MGYQSPVNLSGGILPLLPQQVYIDVKMTLVLELVPFRQFVAIIHSEMCNFNFKLSLIFVHSCGFLVVKHVELTILNLHCR